MEAENLMKMAKMWPYIMEYKEEGVNMGAHAHVEKRDNRKNYFHKGYYLGGDTFVHSITKFLWGTNKYAKPLHDKTRYCHSELDHNNGKCFCP